MRYFVVCAIIIFKFEFIKVQNDVPLNNSLRIVRPPEDYFPKSGILQLICVAEGDPMPSITWYNDKTKTSVQYDESINLKVYSNQGLLIINNPKENEVYEFYCNASNGKQWVTSKPVKTGLSYLSSKSIKMSERILITKESQSAILSCQLPQGNPTPKILWFKDYRELFPEKLKKREDQKRFLFSKNPNGNNSLEIKNLKVTDSGRYQCYATNGYERSEFQSLWILVMNSYNDRIFGINIKQLSQKVGDDVELICTSDFKQSIKWISSKKIFKNDHDNIFEDKLVKKNIKLDDQSIYACESNETNSKLLKIFNLTVSSSEAVEEKVKILKKVVIEGVNVILECDIENTKAEYYWETPQSLPIFPNDFSQPRFRVTKEGYLNIFNAQSSDSGKYTCNVHSSLDAKHKSVWLEVSKHQLDIYPVISLPAQNLTVVTGSNINLKCEVIGEDIIKIIWYSGINIKERLYKDEQISFPNKESLLINNAQDKKNTNFYTCEAINDQGLKTSWTAFVDVVESQPTSYKMNYHELPVPPVVESPKNIKSNSVELVWSSNNNPKFKVLYWIEFVYFGSKNGWEIYQKDWPYNSIVIENLKPDTWYQFLVRSKNDVGIGRASVPTEYVKTKSYMSDEPNSGNVGFQFTQIKLVEPEIVNGNQIKLKWILNKDESLTGFKTSFYAQFYLNYKPVSIINCIVDKSNGYPYESASIPTLNDYCSLRLINSEKLKMLKHHFSPNTEKDFQIPIDFHKVNITKLYQSPINNYAQVSWLVDNITFFQCYNVSVSSKNEFKFINSNYKLILIPESKPSRPPENIQPSWVLPDMSISVKWDMPHHKYWNGIITGSIIFLKSNESQMLLRYNDSLSTKIISQVNPNLNWLISISLENCAGHSVRSDPVLLPKYRDSVFSKSEDDKAASFPSINLFKKSWMIATLVVTSVLIWLMLSFLTVYLCCSKSFKFTSSKFFNIKPRETNEISNNKDFKDELVINPMNNNEKEKIVMDIENKNNYVVNNPSLSPASSNSICNPYASTQIFDPLPEKRVNELNPDFVRCNWREPENMNLFYLSTPIYDSQSVNDPVSNTVNYFSPNTQEWLCQQNIINHTNKNHLISFPLYPSQEECTNSQTDIHFDSKSSPRKDQSVELAVLKNNGTISNLLMSTAPFSDQFSSSKSNSANNSSKSDSSHNQLTNDRISRSKKPNIQSKPNKRRQDPGDFFDQSTEMTHLLANVADKRSPFSSRESNRVYDIPYSDSVSLADKET